MSQIDFTKQVVVLTGSNRGLGNAILKELLKRGVKKVYAMARNPDQIQVSDPRLVKLSFDVTDKARAKEVGEHLADATLLINNAGTLSFGGILSAPIHDIEKDFAVNFFGTLNAVRALTPVLEKNQGAIATVLSLVSLAPAPGISGYSASKAAAYSLMQALRYELKGKVSIYNVYPAGIDTDMLKGVDIAKSNPEDVAKSLIDGLISGQEDIFPESEEMGKLFMSNPKGFEQAFASMAS